MITFTVVSTQFSETFSEANLIQSGQMCLITKHDHPPVQPQLPQERDDLGIRDICLQIKSVDDGT